MEGPEVPEAVRHERRLQPAIAVSLMLHGGLALAISLAAFAPPNIPEPALDRPALRVTVVTESPQRRVAPPPPAVPDVTEEPLPSPAELTEAPASIEDPSTEEPLVEEPPLEAPVPDNLAEATPPGEASPGAAAGPEAVLDINRLQEAISGSMLTYRRDLLDQDMQECQEYRDKYARWDCPRGDDVKSATREVIDENLDVTFRDWMSGYDENERISRELLADMDMMRAYTEQGGIVGELASQRYYLKAVQYEVLNGAANRGGLPPSGPLRDRYVVPLIGFSPAGITILSGFIRIEWDGDVRKGDQANGPAKRFDDDGDD